uniref:Uncharacterized protein n=1 Tax=Ciona intestinalis TaxID=7719 RepID=H2XYM6_CIOIN
KACVYQQSAKSEKIQFVQVFCENIKPKAGLWWYRIESRQKLDTHFLTTLSALKLKIYFVKICFDKALIDSVSDVVP